MGFSRQSILVFEKFLRFALMIFVVNLLLNMGILTDIYSTMVDGEPGSCDFLSGI